ncbi:MAG: RING finger domain-containing protein [Candidatus Baldrarchaeia archaeon]
MAEKTFRKHYKLIINIRYLRVVLSILVILWGIWRLYCYYIWTTPVDLIYGYLMVAVGDLFFITSLINREKLIVPVLYSTSILLVSFGMFSSLYIPHMPSVISPIILGVLILIIRFLQKDFSSIIILSSSTLLSLWAVYRIICYWWWKFSPDLFYGIAALTIGIIGIASGEKRLLRDWKTVLALGGSAVITGGFSYFYLRTTDPPSAVTSLGAGLVMMLTFIAPLVKTVSPSGKEEETTLCYYCGAEISVSAKTCPSCGNKIPICPICDGLIQAGEKTSQCPFCKTLFHKEHLDTWLMVRSICPVCRKKLR